MSCGLAERVHLISRDVQRPCTPALFGAGGDILFAAPIVYAGITSATRRPRARRCGCSPPPWCGSRGMHGLGRQAGGEAFPCSRMSRQRHGQTITSRGWVMHTTHAWRRSSSHWSRGGCGTRRARRRAATACECPRSPALGVRRFCTSAAYRRRVSVPSEVKDGRGGSGGTGVGSGSSASGEPARTTRSR